MAVPHKRFGLILTCILVVAGAAAAAYVLRPDAPLPEGITQQDFDAAATLFAVSYGRDPDRIDVLSLLAEQEFRAGNAERAVSCFSAIPADHPLYGAPARFQQGNALIELNRSTAAIAQFREYLALPSREPTLTIEANRQLEVLLGIQLRDEERREVQEELVNAEAATLGETLRYCFVSGFLWNAPDIVSWSEQFVAAEPESFELQLARVRYLAGEGRLDAAATLARWCVEQRSDDLHSHAALMFVLRERGDWDGMARHCAELPDVSADDPWLLLRTRGACEAHQGSDAIARRCFELLLEQLPTDAEARLGLAGVYDAANQPEQAAEHRNVAVVLGRIANLIPRIDDETRAPEAGVLMRIIKLTREAGLGREAQLLSRFVVPSS